MKIGLVVMINTAYVPLSLQHSATYFLSIATTCAFIIMKAFYYLNLMLENEFQLFKLKGM